MEKYTKPEVNSTMTSALSLNVQQTNRGDGSSFNATGMMRAAGNTSGGGGLGNGSSKFVNSNFGKLPKIRKKAKQLKAPFF